MVKEEGEITDSDEAIDVDAEIKLKPLKEKNEFSYRSFPTRKRKLREREDFYKNCN